VAYLTRGSGKSQGLTALPLDAAAPAARLFAVSPYAKAAAKTDANSACANANNAPAVATI
jgi:hypothetical protein